MDYLFALFVIVAFSVTHYYRLKEGEDYLFRIGYKENETFKGFSIGEVHPISI